MAEREGELSLKASVASSHVLAIFQHGTIAHDIYFEITELTKRPLATRITSHGIEDEEEFWRLASQLASGVADMHRAGILHLGLQVKELATPQLNSPS